MFNPITWLKTQLLEGWGGRLIAAGLAVASGYLGSKGIPAIDISNWVSATQTLAMDILPLLLGLVLSTTRHQIALMKMPPRRS